MHEAVTALSACDSHFSTKSFNSGLVQKVMKLKESPLARHSIASLPHWSTRFKKECLKCVDKCLLLCEDSSKTKTVCLPSRLPVSLGHILNVPAPGWPEKDL